ncbi:hypothetical protein PAXINDRAFT_15708 [Paxillus involutus ATCC 200175]|uniref:Uncharacterized protein n=1 Tax=Paxillus involutus ATCC 200175 TaxID=664439 RepID=A0A0C9TUC8_PAXIN|nr:hypothetical protein PAXINDRAFT_15708 [Paxillus involutus ATCC 200175]
MVVPRALFIGPVVFTPPTAVSTRTISTAQNRVTLPSPITISQAYEEPPPLYFPSQNPIRRPPPPPVHPRPPSRIPQMAAAEPAQVVTLFRGDYGKEEEPVDWFALFQLSLPVTWSDNRKVEQFKLQLMPGSYTEEWFNDLGTIKMASMAALCTACFRRWPPMKKPRWSRVQQKEQIRGQTLQEEDIGAWIAEGWVEDYGQNVWATKVM